MLIYSLKLLLAHATSNHLFPYTNTSVPILTLLNPPRSYNKNIFIIMWNLLFFVFLVSFLSLFFVEKNANNSTTKNTIKYININEPPYLL